MSDGEGHGFTIDDDIRRASTLPAAVYRDAALFELARERVFARSWQLGPDLAGVSAPQSFLPWTMLPGFLDEPLLFARDGAGELRCLSNVCTHRGNLLVREPGSGPAIRCGYHGRRFSVDGRFLAQPEFEGALDFPSACDDLPRARLERLGKLGFVAIDPELELDAILAPLRDRIARLPLDRLEHDPSLRRDYRIEANWALYVDNYLEGFHIPYVHPGLATTLSYPDYRSEVFAFSNLQIGIAREGEEAFEPARASPDHGQRVAGYYFWMFPNTMLNFYPWGISVNVVVPLAVDRTRVEYSAWVWDRSKLGKGAGGALDEVERQDDAIVEAVQRGVRSRLYTRGRYSPSREACVHHFHRLLARKLGA